MSSVSLNGDCLEQLKSIPDNCVDSLVTDPPAGISFMGKAWDDDKGGRKQWVAWMTEVMSECLRVMKPGAHGLVWALPRTSHWTATALEDAGFEVRDVVTHLFGSGFPKSMDVSKAIDKSAGLERPRIPGGQGGVNTVLGARKPGEARQWQGWGTALKPASEHWILVRKPCSEKTVAANVLKWGCGGLNIDASRVGMQPAQTYTAPDITGDNFNSDVSNKTRKTISVPAQGRFPANLVLDETAAEMLDEQTGNTESRFFYVAKASKRDKGTDNTHPTVKSTALMTYLIRIVTPPGGVVLDPFMGSGTTGVAAIKSNFYFIGVEKEEAYFIISSNRIAAIKSNSTGLTQDLVESGVKEESECA